MVKQIYSVDIDFYINIDNIIPEKYQDDEILQLLIKKYKKLNLNNNSKFILNILPEYITHLSIIIDDFKDISFDSLPINLKCLKISGMSYTIFENSLNNLPLSLETLHIEMNRIRSNLDFLPISLKYLYIFCNNKLSLNNLPNNLEHLTIKGYHLGGESYLPENLQNLPFNLKKLNMSCGVLQGKIPDEEMSYLHIKEFFNSQYKNLEFIIINL